MKSLRPGLLLLCALVGCGLVATYGAYAASKPGKPTGLGATQFDATQIDLSWTAPSSSADVTGYILRRETTIRKVGSKDVISREIVDLPTLPATPTAFRDTVPASTSTTSTYLLYKVRAVNAAGKSGDASNGVEIGKLAKADSTAPSKPNVTATANGPKSVTLTWPASDDGVGGSGVKEYIVRRGIGSDDGIDLATIAPMATNTYTDTSAALKANTTYVYKVRAVDNAGNVSGVNAKKVTTKK